LQFRSKLTDKMGILQLDTSQQGTKKILPKKPKQTNSNPDPPVFDDTLFNDFEIDTNWEDDFWMATMPKQSALSTPEPMVEENQVDSIWDMTVPVSAEPVAPTEAFILAENNNNESEMFSFPQEVSEDIDDCWGHGSFPAALVEGIEEVADEDEVNNNIVNKTLIDENAAVVDAVYNLDLVQYALGQSGLDGFLKEEEAAQQQEMIEMKPIATTEAFIHPTETLFTIDPTAISWHLPELQSQALVAKKSKPKMKRSVGRPERQTPYEITQLPKKGTICITPDQLTVLKHKRMRGLNNEASKRCRKNRKDKLKAQEQECQEQEERNKMLKEQLLKKESEYEDLKSKMRAIGYKF